MMKPGRFYGVGVGPGDESLVTARALQVLRDVDVVFSPRAAKDSPSIALSIAGKSIPKDARIVEPIFPMTRDPDVIQRYASKAAREIAEDLKAGRSVAFITLGDPILYSTYGYVLSELRRNMPSVDVETVPGVSSISACLAGINRPLALRDERIAIIPAAYGLDDLEHISKHTDVIVLLKVSRRFDEIVKEIKKSGLAESAFLLSECSSKGFYASDLDSMIGKKVGYLSMIVIRSGA